MSPTPHPPGYTLIELLIVVAVIAIAGLLVVPQGGLGLHASRLGVAANILAADIEYCQSESINDPGDLRQVQFDPAAGKYWLARSSQPTKPIAYPAGGVVNATTGQVDYLNDFATGRYASLTGVGIQSVSVAGGIIKFDAYGRPVGVSGDVLIVLTAGSQTTTVRINATTGDVTIQ